MKQLMNFPAFFLIGVFVLASCKKETAVVPPVPPPVTSNKPPVAKAGTDQAITLPINTVTLNGTGSSDPDGSIVSYSWSQTTGPNQSVISNSSQVSSVVNNLIHGIYQFELKVTDNGGLSAKDTVQVIINSGIINTACPANRPFITARLVPFATLSLPRENISVGAAGDKIVFAGGSVGYTPTTKIEIFDTRTQLWTTTALSEPRWNIAVSSVGDKIFFAGGSTEDPWGYGGLYNNVDIYDAITSTWSVARMSEAREGLAAASVGNKVFFGGGNFYQNLINQVDIYDASANAWVTGGAGTLSEGRTGLSAVTSGNKIYFSGGGNDRSSTFSNRIDIYNASLNSWSTGALSEPKYRHAAIAVNNKIYWAGGITNDPANTRTSYTSNQVEIKDEATQVSTLACLFQPNSGLAAVVKNNQIVFFTGDGAIKNQFDIYDIATNTWSIGVLPQNVKGAAIISVNNTIYVAGGYVNEVLSNQVWKLEF